MMHRTTHNSGSRGLGAILVVLLGVLALGGPAQAATAEPQMRFGTPEAAVEVLLTALKNSDDGTLATLFGAEYAGHLLSKDKIAAREDADAPLRGGPEKVDAPEGYRRPGHPRHRRVRLAVPIPLVRSGTDWRFYTAQGIEEIVNRRIGRNELNAIRVARYFIGAQREYARTLRDGRDVRAVRPAALRAHPANRTGCSGIPRSPTAKRAPSARTSRSSSSPAASLASRTTAISSGS